MNRKIVSVSLILAFVALVGISGVLAKYQYGTTATLKAMEPQGGGLSGSAVTADDILYKVVPNVTEVATPTSTISAGQTPSQTGTPGAPTVAGNISSCTDISSPGEYALTENITDSPAGICINISSSNVIFDGANHTMAGIGALRTIGVLAYNPQMDLTNITVKNLITGNWNYGIIYVNVTGGNIGNNIAEADDHGIHLILSNNSTLSNNTVRLNRYGLVLELLSDNNSLSNNIVSGNLLGIDLLDSNNSNITGNRVFDNNYGIGLVNASNNVIYNNDFNNTNNSVFEDIIYSNNWNITKIAGTNIINGSSLGGNYWATPNSTGFSQTCQDADGDGICDSAFTLPDTPDNSNIDYLPLKIVNMTTNATVNTTANITANTTVNATG